MWLPKREANRSSWACRCGWLGVHGCQSRRQTVQLWQIHQLRPNSGSSIEAIKFTLWLRLLFLAFAGHVCLIPKNLFTRDDERVVANGWHGLLTSSVFRRWAFSPMNHSTCYTITNSPPPVMSVSSENGSRTAVISMSCFRSRALKARLPWSLLQISVRIVFQICQTCLFKLWAAIDQCCELGCLSDCKDVFLPPSCRHLQVAAKTEQNRKYVHLLTRVILCLPLNSCPPSAVHHPGALLIHFSQIAAVASGPEMHISYWQDCL